MVLIVVAYIILLFNPDHSLLDRYEKQSHNSINKHLSIDSYQLERQDFSSGELYQIQFDNQTKAYLLLAEVAACNLGGCHRFEKSSKNGSFEYFDLMVITDESKNILSVEILDYFSEYGYQITSKKYLKKFINKNVCAFSHELDGIDAISGATISSYALEDMLGLLCSVN